MAAPRYDDLDEGEDDLPPVFASLEDPLPPPRPPRSRSRLPWRTIALVVGLGSLLGVGLYALTAGDLIPLAQQDQPAPAAGRTGPRLSLALPADSAPGPGRSNPAPVRSVAEPDPALDQPEALAAPLAAALPPSAAPAQSPAQLPAPAPQRTEPAVPLQPLPRQGGEKPPSFDSLPEIKTGVKPLGTAPLADLLRQSPSGARPGPGSDGREPRQVYARPWTGPAGQARVAVVVAELGLDRVATEAAINRLPPDVTLAFSPYAANLDQWIRKARDHGHEVLMLLPTDTDDLGGFPVDPGAYGLVGAAAPEANFTRIETVLARGPGAAGLLLLGDSFADSAAATLVLGTARDWGLLVVGPGGAPPDRTPARTAVTSLVDREGFREAVDFRLNQSLLAARQTGRAVVVLRPRPLSFERLAGWLGQLAANQLTLAPVSALTQPPPAAGKS